jgi:putative ABC transport system permease protein
MQHIWRDLLYSVRSLSRVPALTLTIVLTVGIGLGATTAMITLIDAVLGRPLPYANPESLVWIYTDNPPFWFRFSVVDYRALEADHPAFSAVAGYQTNTVTVTERAASERVTEKAVSGSYFPLLGQKAHIGRLFDASDDAGNDPIVVLTHEYWTRRFASDPAVLGRVITVDGAAATIVGVLEAANGPLERNVAMFTPARWPEPKRKGPFFLTALGRLRADVTRAVAVDTLRATNRRLFPLWRSSYQDEKATWGLMDLKKRVVGNIGPTLYLVLAAVGCVLLIACANAVNLLIARGLQRTRELAIRGALGASRRRLLQQVLIEAAVVAAGAAAVGLAVTLLSIQLVAAYGASYIPRIGEIAFSSVTVAWLGGLSLLSGLLIGLVPALHGSRVRVDDALRGGGRSMTDGPASRRVRRVLVAAEFALATPLLVAATLVLVSLDRLNRVPVGIEMTRVLTGEVNLPRALYPREEDREAFWKRALDRLAALPGIEGVALADSRPPSEAGQQNNFDLEDHPTPPGKNQPICTWVGVSQDFFKTVGLRLQRGRLLDEHSLRDDVVVVDRAWAQRFFPGEEVLGRRFHEGGCTTCPWTTVVGVVDNVKWSGLDRPEDGTVYYPFVDLPDAFFVLRTTSDPQLVAGSLRLALRELDPSLALANVATGDDLLSDALSTPRYLSTLIGMFALSALVLSVVGIYGVMAYFVQQHTRDIGIRLALGGEPGRVRRLVVFHGLRLVASGVIVGVVAALLATRLMSTLLFGVSATDARTMIGIPLALLGVALAACLIPAYRAGAMDPAQILRES